MRNKIRIIGLVGLLSVLGVFGLRLFNISKTTTTPEEFINHSQVSRETYDKDRNQTIRTVDSLIALRVVYKPAEKALRYFDGQTYEDTVDRKWAIDLPMKNTKYIEHYVDTIFYKTNDNSEFAGLLISKMNNGLAKNGIEYFGNGFLCKRSGQTMHLVINGYRVTGAETRERCSEALHDIYFKEMGLVDSSFNLNDKRYWTSKGVSKITWD